MQSSKLYFENQGIIYNESNLIYICPFLDIIMWVAQNGEKTNLHMVIKKYVN